MRPNAPVPLAAVAALLSLMQGCTTVGPQFTAPPTAAPANWSDWHGGDAALAAGPGASASLPRWEPFLDAPLRELLARTRRNNADIRAAALRYAQARSQRAIAQSGLAPHGNAAASATRQRLSERGTGTRMVDAIGGANREALHEFLSGPFTAYDASFDASWELDLWGRVRRVIEAADARAAESAALSREVGLVVQAEVARTYFELRGVQAQLRLAREDLEVARDTAALVAGRAAGGLVPQLDAVRQRAVEAQLAARIPLLQRDEAALIDRLTLLAGEPPGACNDLLRHAPAASPRPPDLALGIPSELATRRPDVQAALSRLHAATADIGVAMGELYPRIALTGDFGFESLTAGKLADWGSRQWRVGPFLSLPLFDGGRLRRTVQLRELQQQDAAIRFHDTVLKAWHEVDTAVTAYQAERRRTEDIGLQVRTAREALALAGARYQGGLTSFLPVLDAQRTLSQAQVSRAEHEARLAGSWVTLLKALAVPPPQESSTPPR